MLIARRGAAASKGCFCCIIIVGSKSEEVEDETIMTEGAIIPVGASSQVALIALQVMVELKSMSL